MDGQDGLDAILGWNALKVGRIIGARISAGLAAHDVSLVQFGVLSCLADGEELTSADIARAVFVRPQSMSEVLDGMERRGLVQRGDIRARGRRNPVRITAAGARALQAAQAVALATNDLSEVGLDHVEAEQLNHLLLAVVRGAGDGGSAAPPTS